MRNELMFLLPLATNKSFRLIIRKRFFVLDMPSTDFTLTLIERGTGRMARAEYALTAAHIAALLYV